MVRTLIDKYHKMPRQIKASFWFAFCGFIQKGISLITTPIFSRILNTSEYGVINVYNTWHNILIIFASLNLASGGYLRGLIKYEDDSEEFTASLQSLYFVNFGIIFAIYLVFNKQLNVLFQLPLEYVIIMFVDIFVQVFFQFWSVRQRVGFKYKALIIFTSINALINPILGIIFVLNSSDKATARIISLTIADVIVFGCFVITVFVCKKKIVSTKYWVYALKYNIPLVPHYLSQLVLNQSDRLMIRSMVGLSEAGIYSLAYSAAAILTIVNTSILNTYNPWIYKEIRDKKYDNIGKISNTILLIVCFLNLLVIICAPEIIYIMAPSSYHDAIWVIPPVTMSVYFMFLYSLFANFEFYFEKTKYMMIASTIGATLNVILNYVFIPMFGYYAAGYTTLVCYLFYCILHFVLMKIIVKKELPNAKLLDIRFIVLISVFFVVAGFMFMFLYNYSIVRYIIILLTVVFAMFNRKRIISSVQSVLLLNKSKP